MVFPKIILYVDIYKEKFYNYNAKEFESIILAYRPSYMEASES